MTPEVYDKVRLIQQISRQIADILCNPCRTPYQALELAALRERRAEVQATLPPLQLAWSVNP